MRVSAFSFLITILLFVAACKKNTSNEAVTPPSNNANLVITFNNMAGSDSLQFGKNYTTVLGDTINFSTFNYYISNIQLISTKDSTYNYPKNNSYFLVQTGTPGTNVLPLGNLREGSYQSLSFTIGVDSLKSVSDINELTGVLNPAVGMYWTWNSGYIFVKIEGTSPQAPINGGGHYVTYHIGGYGGYSSPSINNIKTITLNFNTPLQIIAGKTPQIYINTDILAMFKSPTPLPISTYYSVMFSNESTVIADHYVNMFSLDKVIQ